MRLDLYASIVLSALTAAGGIFTLHYEPQTPGNDHAPWLALGWIALAVSAIVCPWAVLTLRTLRREEKERRVVHTPWKEWREQFGEMDE